MTASSPAAPRLIAIAGIAAATARASAGLRLAADRITPDIPLASCLLPLRDMAGTAGTAAAWLTIAAGMAAAIVPAIPPEADNGGLDAACRLLRAAARHTGRASDEAARTHRTARDLVARAGPGPAPADTHLLARHASVTRVWAGDLRDEFERVRHLPPGAPLALLTELSTAGEDLAVITENLSRACGQLGNGVADAHERYERTYQARRRATDAAARLANARDALKRSANDTRQVHRILTAADETVRRITRQAAG
jgi:hypothetical protein